MERLQPFLESALFAFVALATSRTVLPSIRFHVAGQSIGLV